MDINGWLKASPRLPEPGKRALFVSVRTVEYVALNEPGVNSISSSWSLLERLSTPLVALVAAMFTFFNFKAFLLFPFAIFFFVRSFINTDFYFAFFVRFSLSHSLSLSVAASPWPFIFSVDQKSM
jgi:hypothetical protein